MFWIWITRQKSGIEKSVETLLSLAGVLPNILCAHLLLLLQDCTILKIQAFHSAWKSLFSQDRIALVKTTMEFKISFYKQIKSIALVVAKITFEVSPVQCLSKLLLSSWDAVTGTSSSIWGGFSKMIIMTTHPFWQSSINQVKSNPEIHHWQLYSHLSKHCTLIMLCYSPPCIIISLHHH